METMLRDPAAGRSLPENRGFDPQDSWDFGSRVTPFLPCLVKAARDVLGSEDLAWDAVQETLMRVWGRGWLPENPRGALLHLVRKSSLHLLRCQRRRSAYEARTPHRHEQCCDEDPLAQVDSAEQAEVVRSAIRSMADQYRAVLELYDLKGESYSAIAAKLELPVGTVRSRLNRGRKLLRERLSEDIQVA